jgi:Ca-dependent carbohydrate-binding module xylan-binding/Family of unknown function (DUF6298)
MMDILAQAIVSEVFVMTNGPTSVPGTPGLLHAAGNYFATADGRAVYLAGNHTWTDGASYSNTGQFDFGAYLTVLQSEGANIVRYWADGFSRNAHNDAGAALVMPFLRSGQGQAQDGGTRFDLTRFNQAYFNELRTNVQAAAARGVYVSVMLFFDYDPGGVYQSWQTNVWNGANNVNGTTTSNAAVEQLGDPRLLSLQEAYVAKVIDTVGDLPNVLFEVANEASNDPATFAWQNRIVDFVHQYEAARGGLRHPVGMTAAYPTGDQGAIDPALNASNADWISPNGTGRYQANPPDATGHKVQLVDTDHVFGIGGDANWVWQQFTRGQNVLVMDDMSGTGLSGTFNIGLNGSQIAAEASERLGIAETRQVSQLVDLTRMAPADGLSSTGYALADPADGEYVAYAPGGGPIRLDLSGASGRTLDIRWMDVGGNRLVGGGTVQAGRGGQSFTAPFAGAAALVLTPHASATEDASPDPAPPSGPGLPTTGGLDTLVLSLSEDAWQGDAQFTVTLDGRQLGGAGTVTARHGSTPQAFTYTGSFGAGPHTVGVTFTNDAYGGSDQTDRNLYVQAIRLNGQEAANDQAVFKWSGTSSFQIAAAAPAPPPTPSAPAGAQNMLVLRLSEDAWQGDAQFTVSVDGRQIGAATPVTASNGAGASQEFAFAGNFGTGPHDVAVSFLNDAYGGHRAADRNLFVDSVSLDGQSSPNPPVPLWDTGAAHFRVAGSSQGSLPDGSLVLHLSEDAWQGNAQFLVSVDGRQLGGPRSVTALHGSGADQAFALGDDFGAGAHTVAVSFVNDAYGGSPQTDRNLYVGSIDYHRVRYADASASLYDEGTTRFTIGAP